MKSNYGNWSITLQRMENSPRLTINQGALIIIPFTDKEEGKSSDFLSPPANCFRGEVWGARFSERGQQKIMKHFVSGSKYLEVEKFEKKILEGSFEEFQRI